MNALDRKLTRKLSFRLERAKGQRPVGAVLDSLGERDRVTAVVDKEQGTIKFDVNGDVKGTAFEDVRLKNEVLYPMTGFTNCTVKLC
jgi:hypothetical protein